MQFFIDHFLPAASSANVNYYWFEGYDEPWKIQYDTATEHYEDHWVFPLVIEADFQGLLDVNGYLKDGITLPDSV